MAPVPRYLVYVNADSIEDAREIKAVIQGHTLRRTYIEPLPMVTMMVRTECVHGIPIPTGETRVVDGAPDHYDDEPRVRTGCPTAAACLDAYRCLGNGCPPDAAPPSPPKDPV